MNETVKGIVISQIDYKDNDAIISVSTDTLGKVSLYVRGYKKISSKNVYATQLFDLSTFQIDYNEAKSVQILKSANLLNEFNAVKADYTKIAVASIMAEIANGLEDEDLFDLLHTALTYLNDKDQPYLTLGLYLVNIMTRLGISPCVDGCVICGNTNQIEAVSIEEGGFICKECNSELHVEKSTPDLLKRFRFINKASFEVYDKLIGLHLDDFKLIDLLMKIFIMYSGISLKSYKSLVNLNH